MSLKDINIESEYRIPRDNIVSDFYLPVLSQAVQYDRSVGYFSSDALIKISYGICQLIQNGGKIRLLVSPNLSEEDYNAINEGYRKREEIVEEKLIASISSYEDYFQNERFNLICELIAQNHLDIKIAFSYNNGKIGLYHEKMGLIHDNSENIISFTGSMNETENGMFNNYETVDVFKSWDDMERVQRKMIAFENLWKNSEKGAITFEFPNAVKKEIIKHNKKREL
ncbi:phospholipase D-like domain-containing protein [Allocoprobacillus halotolerans]|uniref:Phospholipase D-like domain-containing protein n=1 Tax=Allocoprobacillus halotolerans TaxID=2944914 RepID=A0ABY5I4Z5_9FIRM|nr:phospholipase D-like domain-containing protein [Allocoprobacillus halotolerans]UTY39271.1 phospholipase D-like domain-containing protein [Allocoprobacillus halotolerans]